MSCHTRLIRQQVHLLFCCPPEGGAVVVVIIKMPFLLLPGGYWTSSETHILRFPPVICAVNLHFSITNSYSSCRLRSWFIRFGWSTKVAGVAVWITSVCVCTCVCLCVLCVNRVVGRAETAQVDIALSCMGKKSGVLCLWTQTSVGQTGLDRRHHRQKNNKIRNHPSRSLPAHPSSASCPWTHRFTSPFLYSFITPLSTFL